MHTQRKTKARRFYSVCLLSNINDYRTHMWCHSDYFSDSYFHGLDVHISQIDKGISLIKNLQENATLAFAAERFFVCALIAFCRQCTQKGTAIILFWRYITTTMLNLLHSQFVSENVLWKIRNGTPHALLIHR